MRNDSQPVLGFDPLTGQPLPPAPPASKGKKLIAPVWHTVLIVAMILVNSYAASSQLSANVQHRGRIVLYLSTIVTQFLLLLLVWFGLWLKKTKLRELIGGRWNSVEAFLLDVAIAAGFWVVSALILVGVKLALGLASLNVSHSAEQVKQAIGSITPRTVAELAAFVFVAVSGGIFADMLFPGYVTPQVRPITGTAFFGLAHV